MLAIDTEAARDVRGVRAIITHQNVYVGDQEVVSYQLDSIPKCRDLIAALKSI